MFITNATSPGAAKQQRQHSASAQLGLLTLGLKKTTKKKQYGDCQIASQ